MTEGPCPCSLPAPAESNATTLRYLVAVCLLPLTILWHQDNILFTGYGYIDPWLYLGYFNNLVEFKRNLLPGDPFGTHLSWILPGAAIHRLLPPLAANCVLHLGVHTLASVSLFLTLQWVVGARRAFAAAILFSLNPWVWSATAWDYPDGVSIAYCLLTMALLTWAARAPVRRWALVAAGMALAALVYSNSDWLVLAPLLPLYYVGLARAWHGIPPVRSFLVLCGWFGTGCVIATAALGAANFRLDGHFWFYATPVLEAFRRNLSPAPWRQGLWRSGAPSLWLLFAIAAAAAAIAVLVAEGRNAFRATTAAALLSWQFLGAAAWMIWCQARGNPLLGAQHRASILLPFIFLAIGARFWPELATARWRSYFLFCCGVTVVWSYAWYEEGTVWAFGLPYAAWTGIAALLAALVWRRFPGDLIFGVGGFFVLTALGVGPCYSGVDPHGYQDQYQALCRARERVEAFRQGHPVRFWYDKDGRAAPGASALMSTYSWNALLSQSFRTAPCGQEPAPATIIAVIVPDGSHGADFAASALNGCWLGKGLRVEPVETDTSQSGAASYRLSLLRVESVPGAR
jgi:hypothetical protein